jgi:hypothetical protein
VSATVGSYHPNAGKDELEDCCKSVTNFVPRLKAVQNKLLDEITYSRMEFHKFKAEHLDAVCRTFVNKVEHPLFGDNVAEDLVLTAWRQLYHIDSDTTAANTTTNKRPRVSTQLPDMFGSCYPYPLRTIP